MPASPDPRPEPRRIPTARPLIALGGDLEALFDRLARHRGDLTLAQYRVLDALAAEAPAPLEPQHLGRALSLGSNHVTMLLDALEARGLASRRPHPHDRRRRLVSATDAGLEVARALAAQMATLESRIMDAALDPADQELLRVLLAQVQVVVRGVASPDEPPPPGSRPP